MVYENRYKNLKLFFTKINPPSPLEKNPDYATEIRIKLTNTISILISIKISTLIYFIIH